MTNATEATKLTMANTKREQTVDKQTEQIARLSQQLEHSYGQVQDITLKAIEGSSISHSVR